MDFIAHQRPDGEKQSLDAHLTQTGELASDFAEKIGLPSAGAVLGLLHDFGKYSKCFQDYIRSAVGDYDRDDADWVDASSLKGRIDHSTAGAQYVWGELRGIGTKYGQGEVCGQILALCIASHHSGLINCLNQDGKNNFTRRINKDHACTHVEEAQGNLESNLKALIDSHLNRLLVSQMSAKILEFIKPPKSGQSISIPEAFALGVFTRFLFSCLIDADRLNSAEFEYPQRKVQREQRRQYFKWSVAITRLNKKLSSFKDTAPIDQIRRNISDKCFSRAMDQQGIYSLTVPTGGGKTLASLRHALHHAEYHKLDRIIYIIPYTSIIEQNADAVRKIIERDTDQFSWVLEHHSNLEPEQQTWKSKLVSENWDAPIVFTTMVQFLDVLFSSGTRNVRRMHQLARSVLIFDEIQTLPINCVHLFCNALNFLVDQAHVTAVLCTATQPLLNKLPTSEYGEIRLADNPEIVDDKIQLFEDLKRVNIVDRCRPGGWNQDAIVELVMERYRQNNACLVIVNTKSWARDIFIACQSIVEKEALFHLSTNQCPAHRKELLKTICHRLEQGLPTLCISTQLIEAGVDIDFANVIRFLAGLDSIAQAAGRCNRHGRLQNQRGESIQGLVEVVNPFEERLDLLVHIREGQEKTRRVLDEIASKDILSPEAMERYFQYFFFGRKGEMIYPMKEGGNLLELLSINDTRDCRINRTTGLTINQERSKCRKMPLLNQSFMDAGKAFKVIDAPTRGLIVKYGQGEEIINQLCSMDIDNNPGDFFQCLSKAQQYSVNVFQHVWDELEKKEVIYEIQDEGIYYLDKKYYSKEFGVSETEVSEPELMMG